MDQEAEVIQNLSVPIKSFRVFALEDVIQKWGSPALLSALHQREIDEDDDECKMLLPHAILAVQRRLGEGGSPVIGEKTVEGFLDRWKGGDSRARMDLLSALPQNLISDLGYQAPDLFETERDPVVSATILRKFTKTWPQGRTSFLVLHLSSQRHMTRFATLEFLVQRAPDQLVKYLPKLLLIDEPRIKLLAVRGLAAIDMEEALAHLEANLTGTDPHTKISAFQCLFYLPFEGIKPILYRFFAFEKDCPFLERVGQLFMVNPDPEVPYKLWEIAENSPSSKAAVVKKVLQASCKVIETSRILKEDFKNYMVRLQEWIYKRGAFRMVQEIVSRLSDDDAGSRAELEATVQKALKNPIVHSAFEEALSWDIPEKVKEQLGKWVSPPPEPAETVVASQARDLPSKSEAKSGPKIESEPFENLSPEERIRRVALWQSEDLASATPILEKILEEANTPQDLMATSLRAASRLEISSLVQNAEKHMHSNNPNLATAAIEYVGKFDPDRVFPLLGKFFQSPHSRVKSGALRVLQKHDPKEAVAKLSAMLSSNDVEKQALALECLVQFDFSLVRQILTNFLSGTQSRDLFRAGLAFFQANPDQENLYIYYKLEKTVMADFATLMAPVRRSNLQILDKMGLVDKTAISNLEAKHSERFSQEQARKKAAPAPYSLKVLQQKQEPGLQEFFKYVSNFISENASAGVRKGIIGFIVFGTIMMWLLAPPGNQAGSKPQKGRALVAEPISIIGIVQEKLDDPPEITVQAEDGTKFKIRQDKEEFSELNVADKLKIIVVPYRLRSDGIIICAHQNFERL